MRAILLGLVASFFFTSAFVCNRSMDLAGGSWVWSGVLRYLFMLPILLALVAGRRRLRASLAHLRTHWREYLLWSTVGFGLFYAPQCFAASYGEGWLIAATWQVTIIAGPLLLPFIVPREQRPQTLAQAARLIPWRGLRWSVLILAGVAVMQWEHARSVTLSQVLLCIIPLVFAAFMYPLGNRKMMSICRDEVDTFQRVLNMTIASLPFWLLLGAYGLAADGPPAQGQVIQCFLVAFFSGVIATSLFFGATNMVKHDIARLAAVEATQSGEILFAVLGEVVALAAPLPSKVSLAGMGLVILGMLLHSFRSAN